MPNYKYIHKDGRNANSEKGTWNAIKKALGEDEAGILIDNALGSTIWGLNLKSNPDYVEGFNGKADLIVDGEVVGTFYK